jgi:hypothetical protein
MVSMETTRTHSGIKTIGVILLIYALLVATHEGEFWPFSIYPMFSQAGNPWTRAMVLDVTDLPEEQIWNKTAFDTEKNSPVPLRSQGIDQIDFSNFVSKTEQWTESRKAALRAMFREEQLSGNRWMVVKVHGQMAGPDSVAMQIEPWLLLTDDGVFENPNLSSEHYSGGDQ